MRRGERAQESSIPFGVVLRPRRALPRGRQLVPQVIPCRLRYEAGFRTMCPEALDKHPHVVVQPKLVDPRFSGVSWSATAQQHLAAHGGVVPSEGRPTGIHL